MASTTSKEFDPSRKYKVTLSEGLLSSKSNYSVASVQLAQDLKLPQNVKNATISPGFGSNDCELSLTNAVDNKESLYSGKNTKSKTCALIFDHTTGTFVLEQINTQFTFQADNNSPDSEEQSEAAMLSTLIEEEGAAEENNPFDWRNQLQHERTPTPEFDQFRLDTGATPSPAPSPVPRPVKQRPRRASSPPGMTFDFEEPSPAREPEPEPEREEFEIGGEEESDDDGGLQISYDGAAKPKGFRGRVVQRRNDGAPISLRSAANSQSPALRRASTPPDSDDDVDAMQLGSPLKIDDPAQEVDPDELEFEAALANGNDEVDDMEAEFERAMEGDDEDDAPVPAAPAYVVDDSSSESEEE